MTIQIHLLVGLSKTPEQSTVNRKVDKVSQKNYSYWSFTSTKPTPKLSFWPENQEGVLKKDKVPSTVTSESCG